MSSALSATLLNSSCGSWWTGSNHVNCTDAVMADVSQINRMTRMHLGSVTREVYRSECTIARYLKTTTKNYCMKTIFSQGFVKQINTVETEQISRFQMDSKAGLHSVENSKFIHYVYTVWPFFN